MILFKKTKNEDKQKRKANITEAIMSFLSLVKSYTNCVECLDFSKVDDIKFKRNISLFFLLFYLPFLAFLSLFVFIAWSDFKDFRSREIILTRVFINPVMYSRNDYTL